MDTVRHVGSSVVRWTTAALALVSVLAAAFYTNDVVRPRSGQSLTVLIASGIVTFIAFVHTSRAIYTAWLRFAAALHAVMITLLFGAIYLIVVALFALVVWPFDILRVRKRTRDNTFWISKSVVRPDLRSFQRMG
jgi:hypothetical protein